MTPILVFTLWAVTCAMVITGIVTVKALRLAREMADRDAALLITALKFGKAQNVEEAVRAGALEKSLNSLADHTPRIVSDEEKQILREQRFAHDLVKGGQAISSDGTTFELA